jgi:hypothetical protein
LGGLNVTLTTYIAEEAASTRDFVNFWAQQYNSPREHLYTNNIGKPLTAKRVYDLFEWKNGSRLSAPKRRSVEQNYIRNIRKVNRLPQTTNADTFLLRFPSGGAIWRIFWLHCWQPSRFPIYDQHVHRAMAFIEQRQLEEIPGTDAAKVESYLKRYLPFHERFREVNSRSIDRALWFYGKFVKGSRFPLP